MNLTKEELLKFMNACDFSFDWVSPEWEPIVKCKEENRKLFMFGLHILSLTAQEELGTTTVKWSNCDPERSFEIVPD